MTSITARNAKALTDRNGTTVPEAPKRTRKAVAKSNEVVAPSNEAAPKATPTPVDCHCGCGTKANLGRSYRPGHDARHAGQVARANIEGKAGAAEALELLPPALKAKAARMIANAATKAERKAKAAEIRKAAKDALNAQLAAL